MTRPMTTPFRVIAFTALVAAAQACAAAPRSAAPRSDVPRSELRQAAPRPHAEAPEKKVLVIGVDGVRVDVMRAMRLPNIEALVASGMLSDAQARMPTVSGPGWSSILTGVWS